MTTEEFYTYQEQLFDAFSKRVIKNLGIDIFHEMDFRREKEVSLSLLPQRDLIALCTVDTYQLERSETIFFVGKERIVVTDSCLGQALHFLSPKHRNVLLLLYFADKNELQIGKILNITAAAVNYRKKKGLDSLRGILEAMKHEET